MNQILIMQVKVWSSLNENEKNIIQFLADTPLTWGELLEKTTLSRATFNKYLTNLRYRGIVTYSEKKYAIEDDMLKTWLQHEKEVNGFYPI